MVMEVIITYTVVSILLILSGWISIIGSRVRYFYFALGAGINSVAIEKFNPTWLVVLCIVIASLIGFAVFNAANKRIKESFVIPGRISTNMSAYFIGGIVGIILACL